MRCCWRCRLHLYIWLYSLDKEHYTQYSVRMKIHKEGYSIILVTMALAVFITTVCAWLLPPLAAWIVAGAAALFVLFVTSFFRSPSRIRIEDPETVFAPADGTVVVVDEVT